MFLPQISDRLAAISYISGRKWQPSLVLRVSPVTTHSIIYVGEYETASVLHLCTVQRTQNAASEQKFCSVISWWSSIASVCVPAVLATRSFNWLTISGLLPPSSRYRLGSLGLYKPDWFFFLDAVFMSGFNSTSCFSPWGHSWFCPIMRAKCSDMHTKDCVKVAVRVRPFNKVSNETFRFFLTVG